MHLKCYQLTYLRTLVYPEDNRAAQVDMKEFGSAGNHCPHRGIQPSSIKRIPNFSTPLAHERLFSRLPNWVTHRSIPYYHAVLQGCLW